MKLTRPQLIVIGLLPLILWIAWALVGIDLVVAFWDWRGGKDATVFTKLGQGGDLFGGINALFAAYAFAGVAVAAYFQYESFKVLKEQRALDSFEPLFFKLLELIHSKKPLILVNSGHQHGVAQAVEMLAGKIESGMDAAGGLPTENVARDTIVMFYTTMYSVNESVLGPYFRSLYQLFKRIDTSQLDRLIKIQYANIARATLDPDELFLLMLNCADPSRDEFRRLIEEYGVLKHLSTQGEDTHCRRMARVLPPLLYRKTATMSSEARMSRPRDG